MPTREQSNRLRESSYEFGIPIGNADEMSIQGSYRNTSRKRNFSKGTHIGNIIWDEQSEEIKIIPLTADERAQRDDILENQKPATE